MKNLLCLFICFMVVESYGQTVVFDREHFSIVNANAAVRNANEIGYHQTLNIIRQNTDDIILIHQAWHWFKP
mgnify:CR=1 FL=1